MVIRDSIEVYDSYKFSDGTVVAFLKSVNKLSPKTLLEDSSNRQWMVIQLYWTTGSPETYEMREAEEGEGIFQYILTGVNHCDKPQEKSLLKMVGHQV